MLAWVLNLAFAGGGRVSMAGTSVSTGRASLSSNIAIVSRSGRVSSGTLLQISPVRFGWSEVVALSQTGVQAAESAYIEGSTVYVQATYFDIDDNPLVPALVSYSVDDVVSGENLVPWTAVAPASSNIVTINATQNAMVNATRSSEQHEVIVKITDSFGGTFYASTVFDVIRAPGLG